jgi:hypothetical protein
MTPPWTNDKATYLGITNSIGLRCGFHCGLGRKPHSCGQSGHKVVAISEWRARIAPTSTFEQCIFCLPNTNQTLG